MVADIYPNGKLILFYILPPDPACYHHCSLAFYLNSLIGSVSKLIFLTLVVLNFVKGIPCEHNIWGLFSPNVILIRVMFIVLLYVAAVHLV